MTALSRIGVLALLLAAWALASVYAPRGIIPTPGATFDAAQRLWESGQLWTALGDSLTIYGTGLGLAALVGIVIGVLMALSGRLAVRWTFCLWAGRDPARCLYPLIILLWAGRRGKDLYRLSGRGDAGYHQHLCRGHNADSELIEMARSTGAGGMHLCACDPAGRRPSRGGPALRRPSD